MTTGGTISVDKYTQNKVSRPGNDNRANAYAARIANTTCPSVIPAVTSAVCIR